MRSSLTRSHLHELENRPVIYKSFYQDKKPPLNGTFKLLLRNVQLGLYDPNKCVHKTPFTHHCDHCWIVLPEVDRWGNKLNSMLLKRYSKGFGFGTVSYYTRSDMSVDLSITPLPFLSMEKMPRLMPDLSNLNRVIDIHRNVLELVKKQKSILISQFYNHSESVKILRENLKYYEGIQRSQSLKHFQAGTRKKVTSASSFKDLLLAK